MSKGDIFNDQPFQYKDKFSGCTVTRLTNYTGHSNHLYFTDPCWFNDARSLIFISDRNGQSNLFRYDLNDHRIMQLTDLSGESLENERVFDNRPQGAYSKANGKYYYWWQNGLYELNVDNAQEQLIYQAPPEKVLGIHAISSADGKYICNMMRPRFEDAEPEIDYPYSRFPSLFPRKPRTQIIRIELATGKMDVIHEDDRFMTHVNLSPTQADILTFCHEGPWHLVEQRIWGLNIHSGETWKIRPQDDGEFAIGHEYWFADGERIGYHGRPRSGKGDHVFGYLKWDNTEHTELRFPFHSWHFHSLDEKLIVGDGTATNQAANQPFIQLFQLNGKHYSGPKILATHRSTFNHQHSHCHPRFSPNGKSVLYSSDLTGYANMYLVEFDDYASLPDLTPELQP